MPADERQWFDPSRYGTSQTVLTGLNTGDRIIEANPNRVYLGFASNGAMAIDITLNQITFGTQGIPVPTTGGLIEIYWARHGPLVTAEWFAANAGGAALSVFQVWLLPRG